MRRPRAAAAVAAVAAAVVTVLRAAAALADDGPAPSAVRAARDAVFARPEFRYDAPERGESLLRQAIRWVQGLAQEFQQSHPVLFLIVLGASVAALAAILAHLVWTWRAARRASFETDDPRDLEAALRRLDPAPFRRLADEHARAGRMDEALRDLWTALLLVLDRRGALRYAGHKALLDYRIEAAADPGARAALGLFAESYPPGSFGRRPPDAARFAVLAAAVDGLAAEAAA